MNGRLVSALVIGAALGGAAIPSFAIPCYEVIDQNDTVILRAVTTPVDLSDAGCLLGSRCADAANSSSSSMLKTAC